jgi:hypothetical protein
MLEGLPIDLIVEIGILAGPDEYEQISQTSKRNAIILQKPYIMRATTAFITPVKHDNYTEYAYMHKQHSFNDQPALIYMSGTKWWYNHGTPHRDNDLPAVIFGDGEMRWFQHGEHHRDNDQPSVIHTNGTKLWYHRGKLHRDNNLPAVIYQDESKKWYHHGKQTKQEIDNPHCVSNLEYYIDCEVPSVSMYAVENTPEQQLRCVISEFTEW